MIICNLAIDTTYHNISFVVRIEYYANKRLYMKDHIPCILIGGEWMSS